MTRSLAAILLGAASLLIAGCADQGPPFEKAAVATDNMVIYVYRPYHYAGSLLRPAVTCGDDTARIGPGGYHAFVVPAGHLVCKLETTEAADEVEIDPAPRVHYVREEIGWGVLTGHPHLDPVDADKAQSEIQQCCVKEPDVTATPQ